MALTKSDIEPAFSLWPQLAGHVRDAHLVNHSENETFRIDCDGGEPFMLRVHRPEYQTEISINSELAWLAALRRDTDLPISEPVAGRDGALLQNFETPAGEQRRGVLFRFIAGREPGPDEDLVPLFRTLGTYAARMHLHVMSWTPPAGFERQVWNAATILDVDGLWGDWRVTPGVDARVREVLDRLCVDLAQRLADYGTGADRYGLIHADMRLGNLLVEGSHISLIDFDDSGFCWFAYDFAAAVSFHETQANIPALKAAWVEGYQSVRALSGEDIAMLDAMVMLRRMALLAWIGSHAETNLAQTHMDGYAEGSADLAERFIRGPIWG
ncbi:MAG: phosphotransferase [Devosia sp.]|uniref:phosphotransferase enzyme family protein n=1 Tax=Devosia sp. TaxID=1871048 RepID=UPI0019FED236|nr:phosphotransferase [Devosia sp.]MBF0678943.1 phosphotransferase [Devosia sp.]